MKEIQNLHDWFEANKRDFPWRIERTPYRVLVSEIMLQQTRASVVIPYFERWMQLFPTVEKLAEASQELVIKSWEGLGYYSRARNLHAAAKQIVEVFGGFIPDSAEKLATIRGLGPYTVGAILSFGFQKRAAAVDGNVARVLSRFFLVEEEISRARAKRRIGELAEKFLDGREPWVTVEALIELGASICSPKPRCEDCPIQKGCEGFRTGKAESLPIKSAPLKTIELFRNVYLIEAEGSLLVKKGEGGKVMADLYEFPYVEKPGPIESWLQEFLQGKIRRLDWVKHSFTRYLATLHPFHVQVAAKVSIPGFTWVAIEHLKQLPFSSGHRKILQKWIG